MAIKFDQNLNNYIKRTVDAFNKKVARAEKKGLKYLPSKQSIKDFKEAYGGQSAKRAELKRELKELESFNLKNASQLVKLDSEELTSKYNYNLARKHQRRLRNQIDKEIAQQKAYTEAKPHLIMRRSRLSMLENVKESLMGDIKSRDTMRSINAQYGREYSSERLDNFYDSFFEMMKQETKFIGYDENKIKTIEEKLRSVDPDTLIRMRQNSPYIATIMDRYDSDESYNQQDIDALTDAYNNLYDKLDSIIEEFSEDYEVL